MPLIFGVTISRPLTVAVPQLSAQGTMSGGNFATVNTDDPETAAASDASVTLLDLDFDFGDAPTAAQSGFAASYPTDLAGNGARMRRNRR